MQAQLMNWIKFINEDNLLLDWQMVIYLASLFFLGCMIAFEWLMNEMFEDGCLDVVLELLLIELTYLLCG